MEYYRGEKEDIDKTMSLLMAYSNDVIVKNIGGQCVNIGDNYNDIIRGLFNMSNGDIKRNNMFVCGIPLQQNQSVQLEDFVVVNNRMGLLIKKNKNIYRFIYYIPDVKTNLEFGV